MLKPLIAALCLALPAMAEQREVRLGERSYLIDLPAKPQGAPILVALHGGGGSPSQFARSFAAVSAVRRAFLAQWPGVMTGTTRQVDRHDDGTAVTVTDHASTGRVVVRVITVIGGGHQWPGGRKARAVAGKTQEIRANAKILRFFALHP